MAEGEETPRRRERNPEDTKKRILAAAEVEFAQRGFYGARLRDIAASARATQALIHHHFGDKAGLYRAVLDRAVAETTEGSWTILSRGDSVEDTLDAMVELLLRFHERHGNLLAILGNEAQSGQDELFLDVLRERTGPLFLAVRERVGTWQREGNLRDDLPPDELIVATLSLTLFPYQEAPLLSVLLPGLPPPSVETKKAAVLSLLSRGALGPVRAPAS